MRDKKTIRETIESLLTEKRREALDHLFSLYDCDPDETTFCMVAEAYLFGVIDGEGNARILNEELRRMESGRHLTSPHKRS